MSRSLVTVTLLAGLCSAGMIAAQPAVQQSGDGMRLAGIDWKLTRLSGSPVTSAPDARELFIHLNSLPRTVDGFGVCNRFQGGYTVDDGRLEFVGITATARACLERTELERALFDALSRTTGYRFANEGLELLDREMRLLARFEPR